MGLSVFVTTYYIGNTKGFTIGRWFDLEDYADKEDFLADAETFCKETLKDPDPDPEICFSDYDSNIPDVYISESHIHSDLWEWLELSDNDKKKVSAYYKAFNFSKPVEVSTALEAFIGEGTAIEMAQDLTDLNGWLDDLPTVIRNNLDWQGIADELLQDYTNHKNFWFHAR